MIQILLAETTVRADGMFVDAILEIYKDFAQVFKDTGLVQPPTNTIAESIFNSTEEAKVFISFSPSL